MNVDSRSAVHADVLAILEDVLKQLPPQTHAAMALNERIQAMRKTRRDPVPPAPVREPAGRSFSFTTPPPIESRPHHAVHEEAGPLWMLSWAERMSSCYRHEARWVLCRSRDKLYYWAIETRNFQIGDAYQRSTPFYGPFMDRENACGQARSALLHWSFGKHTS